MVVLDSPFAALQLVGLMLPVVVLTLKAHVQPLREEEHPSRPNPIGMSEEQRKIRRASAVAIVSLLAFIASALVALGGQFATHAADGVVVSLLWATTVGVGFLSYAGVVGLWLYELLKPETVEVL